MAKICTVGSATQDIFISADISQTMQIALAGDYPHKRSFLLFEQGRKIDVPALHFAIGGGAANAAVTAQRFGHESYAFFNTADDETGQIIRKRVQEQGVELLNEPYTNQKSRSGRSFIFVTPDANHVVFSHRGVNRLMRTDTFPLALISELDYLHFSPLSGQSKQLLPYIAKQAKQHDVPIMSNPGLGQLSYNPAEYIDLLSSISILQVNAFEARTLFTALLEHAVDISQAATHLTPHNGGNLPLPPLCELFMQLKGIHYTIFDLCSALFEKQTKMVIVTDGGRGVYVVTPETLYFHPPLPAKVISGLGAGDAFGSAFLSALAHKKDIETALIYGVVNATAVLESLDAQSGILTLEEAEKRAVILDTKLIQKYPMGRT